MKLLSRVAVCACLFLLGSACDSDDSDDDDDDDGQSEQASCTFPSDDGPTCVDYRGDKAFVDNLRSTCAPADGVLTDGELCPTAGVSGICSDEGDNRSRLFYYDVTDGLDVLAEACTSGGGTWSPGAG